MRAAELFENDYTQADAAYELGVSRQSASRWYHAWKKGGSSALTGSERTGRKARLSAKQIDRLVKVLTKGARANGFATELWTLQRVAIVIERLFGHHYHPSGVWRVLRRLGWSVQRPRAKAKERNDDAIVQWKFKRWPQVKKHQTARRLDRIPR